MNKTIRIAVIGWMLFVSSCQVYDSSELIGPVSQEITIEEAKTFINSQKAGARVSRSDSKTIRTEFWNDAQKLSFENGLPVVVVPLSYNFENQTVFQNGRPGKGKRYDKRNYTFESKLLVYKNREGKMMADMVRFIPEADSRKGKRKIAGKDFSGYVLAYDQSGSTYKGGWYYEKGKPQKRVRIDGAKKARLASSDCDILIYRPADPDRPAQLGTGAPASAGSAYYDSQGNLWVLDEVIPMPCGGSTGTGNSDGPVDGSPGYVPPGYGDPSWIWNTYGGGNGGSNSTYSPFTMNIIGDFGIFSFDAADNFFLLMLINKAILFDADERQLIRENWGILYGILSYTIEQTGQKPTTLMVPPSPNRTIKVVGRDGFNESTDFRLYTNKCDALAYLKNKTQLGNAEVGAYVTNQGIVIGPNSEGSQNSYNFSVGIPTFYVNGVAVSSYHQPVLTTTNMGNLNVASYIHT
ncbi:MAG: hypothetical protein LH609_18080, partial [Rudanella sp.]|nr:hypothetical protein [Rudanella sp.]